MTRGRLVVHAHFYQPFRVDPFTDRIPDDRSAAPFRNWNERITAECYRPIAEPASGPHLVEPRATLTAYLAREAPAVLARFAELDRAGGGTGMAQAFHHSILRSPRTPTSAPRSCGACATSRGGSAARRRRCGCPRRPWTSRRCGSQRRPASHAVILAPWQADGAHVDPRRPYRVDVGGGRHITAMFYDGELSAASRSSPPPPPMPTGSPASGSRHGSTDPLPMAATRRS